MIFYANVDTRDWLFGELADLMEKVGERVQFAGDFGAHGLSLSWRSGAERAERAVAYGPVWIRESVAPVSVKHGLQPPSDAVLAAS